MSIRKVTKLNEWPKIGDKVTSSNFEYEFLGIVDHTCRDGRDVKLGHWQGTCANCAEPFTFMARGRAIPENRRCDEHKQPGVKVRLPS